MNKKAILGAVALVVVAAAVYFIMNNGKKDDGAANTGDNVTQVNVDGQTQQQSQPSGQQSTSLKNLMAGSAQSCTYADGVNSGTIYTANGKMRMDATSVTNGVSTSVHSVIDDQYYYSWVDGQPSGFKFSVKNNATGTGSTGSNQNVDINKTMSYDCGSWSTDGSRFDLPAGITFTDFSSFGM